MVSLKLTSSLPFNSVRLFRPYANIAAFGNTLDIAGYSNSESLAYEFGLTVGLIPTIFDVYLPILASSDIK